MEDLVVFGKGLRWSSAFSTETGNEECRKIWKQPISVSNLQEFGMTKEMDQELRHFFISRFEGVALEAIRGAERDQVWDSGEDQLRSTTQWQLDEVFDDNRQNLSPPTVPKVDDRSPAAQAWENLEQSHGERTGDSHQQPHPSSCSNNDGNFE